MTSPSPQQALWHLARFGIAAQQSLRLRVALMRGRFARHALILAVLGLVLASAAILLALAALVMVLISNGYSPQAALGLVAGGTAALAVILLLLGRNALSRALSPRP
jgi:hypothetical protein